MALARDAIYQALHDHLKNAITGVQTWSRKAISYDQLGSVQQPTVEVFGEGGDAHETHPGLPLEWTLLANIRVYVREDYGTPETALNAIVDKIEKALERLPTESSGLPTNSADNFATTLAGLVRKVAFVGYRQAQGAEGQQAEAILTVKMLATAFNP